MPRRGLLPVYAPLCALAAVSFWLTPGEESPPSADYAVSLQEARYTRATPEGTLHLAAERIEYDDGEAKLYALQLSRQTADGGRVVLRGESGIAQGDGEMRRFSLARVRGEIAGGGQLLTLRAESVSYDLADGGLSGVAPHISAGGAELRGDRFVWRPGSGWRVEGDVEGVY